jgi:TonB family protein
MVRPRYPKKVPGTTEDTVVELRVVVAPDGKIKQLQPDDRNSTFISASAEAVRKWRFYPLELQGHPVEAIYKVSIHFNSILREAVPTDVSLEAPHHLPSLAQFASKQSTGEPVHTGSENGIVTPKPIHSPEPEFSEASRRNGEHGTVDIALVVGTDGLPRDLQVTCSSIPNSNQNAIDAVREWKFAPAIKDGTPVAFAVQVEIAFKSN